MKKVPVRRLFDFKPEEFIFRLKSPLAVEYEDGAVIEHTAHEVTVNRYIFSLVEMFPNMEIISKYSVHNYYSAGVYVASTINRAFESIAKDIISLYVEPNQDRSYLESAYEKMYIILEDIYNNVIYNNLHYVSSLNIRDFLDIQLKPELMDAINNVRIHRDLESINKSYDVLDNVIKTSDDLDDNPIARGYLSGTINKNQVKQLLASRGFVTEIDSSIFKYPIASSFVLGLDNMYDMAVESRSGAKALYLSNRAISMAEYFAREMQLVTMSIEKLVDGDCGNRDTIEWAVTDKDFKNLIGKHYFVDDTELVIDKDSRGIIGTTILLRNAIRCKVSNKRHICTACFGRLSTSIPKHANLGHISSTVISAMISQLTLSTKHITTSASSDSIALDTVSKKFLIIKNKDKLVFRAGALSRKNCTYALHIPQEQGAGLADIQKSNNVRRLNLARVSRLEYINLSVTDQNGKVEDYTLCVKQGTRYGNFTYDFLEHIIKYGYSLDSDDRFVIDLTDWSINIPFITMPQVEFNYIDLAKAIKEEFKSMRESNDTPEAFLHKIFGLINSKLNINIALLEVIVYAFTVCNPDTGNFDIGRKSPDAKQTKMINIMTNRSLGGAFAWEHVRESILSPKSLYGRNNIDHPLDVMLKPNEALLDYYNKL